jgi:hypothetical protein
VPILATAQADAELQRMRDQAKRAVKPPPGVLDRLKGLVR